MASLALSSPSQAHKASSFLSSSSSSLFSRSSLGCKGLASGASRSRTFAQIGVKCDMQEPLNIGNGKPSIPILNERTLPKFLETARMEKAVNRTNNTRLKLFTGTANSALSQEIARYMGLELGKINIKRFADGEIYVQLQESVRGCDVFLVQPTCPPANENLMELLVMVDACRRASAKNITVVIPYFGYARADRKASFLLPSSVAGFCLSFCDKLNIMMCMIHLIMLGDERQLCSNTTWMAGVNVLIGIYLPICYMKYLKSLFHFLF
ncbi:ribose-phosphate pyrophosphokinase 1 [Tripterygium wilfordii]|uniref:ribose-phosphate diphosphokinase n=1 Tax=Tripterygium wilfordii TaxID=458696 RepID=A0A7J7CM48_TRIWF|nr:ribose-phosphate pyrophosphokinase 1 [Tripterygium wilfordii]